MRGAEDTEGGTKDDLDVYEALRGKAEDRRRGLFLEIRISGFNQPLNDRKNHRGRYAEEKHSICCFQGA